MRALRSQQKFHAVALKFLYITLTSVSLLALVGATTYIWIASQLPPAETLRQRTHQFATTQIFDKQGHLLWEIIDPTGGRRTDVTLDKISPHLVQATLATEDRYFYLNVGVDPIAITRAVYSNLSERQIVSGASTITQQLARNVLLTPKERIERTFSRKIREAVLAVEINRRYTKDQILELYLNQIYYGNLAYGIEAAAQTYFDKSAGELTLSEASLLAGLPQSPAIYDPYQNPEGAKFRQADVLRLMVEAGYLTTAEAQAALDAPLELRDPNFSLEAPHFVTLVRQELEQNVPPAYIYQAGLRVYTTLDSDLQAMAEDAVRRRVEELADQDVSNGALAAMDVDSGHILALVGSKDFRDSGIDGQVNMAASPRQPASTIKPLTYLAAFERLNWTPSTVLMDVPVEYPDEAGNVYRPRNIDDKFHGPVSIRTALANSYNIPAVKTLEQVKISSLKEMATRLGITTLTRDDYGLSLALGSGEVSLMEMTGAYQVMANRGIWVKPTSILKITDNFDREIEPIRLQPRRLLHEAHAYLITHILADAGARTAEFDPNRILQLSRPAAAKTGTTNDFRDSWTIGYTPEIVAGVWLGNADNRAMDEVDGLTGAGHVWRDFMERAHQERPIEPFIQPPSVVEMEVCVGSGTLPSELCPETYPELFFQEQPPPGPEHDLHRRVEIDANTNLLANEFCRSNVEKRYYYVLPPEARAWAVSQGIEQPPATYCPSSNLAAKISDPVDGISVRGEIDIIGSMVAPKISYYQLELGRGTNPAEFQVIQPPNFQLVRRRGLLGTFDTTQVENGPYTLRLVISDQIGGLADDRVRLLIDNAPETIALTTPAAIPPPTFTPVPAASPALTQTVTFSATAPPTVDPPTATPSETPIAAPALATPTPSALTSDTFEPPTPTLTPQPTLTLSSNVFTRAINIPPQPAPDR